MPLDLVIDPGETTDAGLPRGRDGGDPLAAARDFVAGPIGQPLFGRVAPEERSTGFWAAAAIAERLSRTARTTPVAFADYLRDLCSDLVLTFGRSLGVRLTCTAAEGLLPIGTAVTMGLIAEQLVCHAVKQAFSLGQAGRVAVRFSVGAEAWQLVVEDSGRAMRGQGGRREHGLLIARLLVLQLDGTLEMEEDMIGGSRCIVTVPRPAHPA